MKKIHPYESEDGIIFFYSFAHGEPGCDEGHSWSYLTGRGSEGEYQKYADKSGRFVAQISALDATTVGYLIDGCYAGYFIHDVIIIF